MNIIYADQLLSKSRIRRIYHTISCRFCTILLAHVHISFILTLQKRIEFLTIVVQSYKRLIKCNYRALHANGLVREILHCIPLEGGIVKKLRY